MKLPLYAALASLLLLGACASVPTPDSVQATYVSAKPFVFADCSEMQEELARATYAMNTAKTKEKIAAAKGEYEAIIRSGYSKHCGDARYADHGPQQAPAPAPQVIVVQAPAAPPQVIERVVERQVPVYQPVPVYQAPVYQAPVYAAPRPQYQYREGLAPYPSYNPNPY